MAYRVLECFNDLTLTVSDRKEAESYNIIKGTLMRNHDMIADGLLFGKDMQCQAMLQMDLLMLVLFFKMIDAERREDFDEVGFDWQSYNDTYCLDSIKDAFYCRGVITDELETLWKYWYFDWGLNDGVGEMQIEGSGELYPIFRVRGDNE